MAAPASSSKKSVTPPKEKVKTTPGKVRDTLELLGIDLSDFEKYKAYHDSKITQKIATNSE